MKYLQSILAVLVILVGIVCWDFTFVKAAQPAFNSAQLAPSAANGYILQTNGTNNSWVANSGGGSFPFTPATNYGVNTSATTTALWGQASIFASSTSATNPAFSASNNSTGPAAVFGPGNVGIGTTSPYAKFGVVGTSTFAGDVVIGGDSNGTPNPYLLISTSTNTIFGRVPGDIVDAQYSWNGQTSINVINGSTGPCASATFFADGNNPTLGGYFGTFSFLNDGWTGVGCSIGAGTGQKPEAVAIASPTGEMDFIIASTTNTGSSDFNWFTNTNTQVLKLTNGGNLGIGTTSPYGLLSINAPGGATPNLVIGSSSGTELQESSAATPMVGIGTSSPLASRALSVVGPTYVENAGANAFSVGSTGTTSLAFNIDQSAGVGTGLGLTTQVPASGVTLIATSPAAAEALTVSSKSTGNLVLASPGSSGNIILQQNGATKFSVNLHQAAFTPGVSSSASQTRFSVVNGADTALTTLLEAPWVYFNGGTSRQHAAGAIAVQRDFRITGSPHAFVSGGTAANTIASTSAVSIDGPDAQGTLSNYTNDYGLFIGGANPALTSASTTNAYGLAVLAPAGATNNYAAEFLQGNVGVGTTSPISTLTVNGGVTMHGLAAGAGNGALCATTDGLVSYDAGANCIVSSERFKNTILPLTATSSLAEVLALKPVSFKYNQGVGDSGKATWEGFIAEQVDTVDKRLVQYDAEGKPYSVYYQNFTAILAGAIQQVEGQIQGILAHQSEQDKKIETQQAEIDQLQAQIKSLQHGNR